jgi:hypothetical protein
LARDFQLLPLRWMPVSDIDVHVLCSRVNMADIGGCLIFQPALNILLGTFGREAQHGGSRNGVAATGVAVLAAGAFVTL